MPARMYVTARLIFPLVLTLVFIQTGPAQWNPANMVKGYQRLPDGVQFAMHTGLLRIQLCNESLVHVLYSPGTTFPDSPEYVIVKRDWSKPTWAMDSIGEDVILRTSTLSVRVARNDGTITFTDSSGRKLFADNGRSLSPVVVNEERTYHAEMFSNLWGSSEAFYGLGQHQAGVWNYRGEAVDISHDNTNIGIPFFLSSNGYGIFWNNSSRSRFNNRFLSALYLSSEVADVIDYYFIYGPEYDTIIGAYRELTGGVPMFGKWAYGFWQCKNRYKSQGELLDVARKYRQLHIPVDNIVQDWFWWYTMGEPVFDKARYPDPQGMVDELHKSQFHLMISFWPYFRPGTKTYDDMDKRGFFIDRTKVAGFHPAGQGLYDAFNPAARKYYWDLMDSSLFRIGVDAWWLDTTEPETEGREANVLVSNRVAIGNGARFVNLFPLMASAAVYEGQRKASDGKRVFILSRSGYAGSQRNAVTLWSGDVNADWVFFRKQIPAGLNLSISGLPNWTTDIGGFVSGDPDDPAYRELFVRWFQFGTFCPIFRVHGTRSTDQNELWSYGSDAQKILVSYDRLRYRLLPYIYSLAWKTSSEGYTPMRALVMDFRADTRAANVGDQFMFGPAFLVNPVTEPDASTRHLYLPRTKWYDFWSGISVDGGRSMDAEAPLPRLPLFVRAGSIVPMGPDIEWSTQKQADPIELRVYRGASASFTLYEDENDNYNYEQGMHSTINFRWDDSRQQLTIGARTGTFPGMLEKRIFRVVFVGTRHGEGIGPVTRPDKIVEYFGKETTVRP